MKLTLAKWLPSALLSSLAVLVDVPLGSLTLPPACMAGDNGSGTVSLSPEGCAYLSPEPFPRLSEGFPSGTTIQIQPTYGDFLCDGQGPACSRQPGGTLGGEVERFPSTVRLRMVGTGGLAGFSKALDLPARVVTHVAPRTRGQRVQPFAVEMIDLAGGKVGDADFAVLRISAGRAHGMPSPGKTVLTRQADGRFKVESTYRIAYRIEFRGAPGGPLAGRAGTTRGTVLMKAFAQPG